MAIEAEELATISRSIRSAGQETAGEFRQAANASNANLARIVKDISMTFKAQREDLADLRNVLEEMVSESQQTGNKIDSLNSLFRESLEIQNAIATQMSNVTRNTRILSSDIESLNRNIMNSTSGGLLGSITGIGKDVADSLLAAGIGAAVGGLAGYGAAGGFGGGSVTDSSVGKGSAEFQSITPKLTKDLQRDFPGLTKEDAAAIIGNLGEESGGFTKMQEAGGRGPGRGWAQWTSPDRKAKFLANVQKHGGDLANYDANYETLRDELKGQYAGALKEMMAAQGLENKTRVFMRKFENPGVPAFDVRMRYAQRAMNVFGESTPQATPQASTPSTAPSAPEVIPSATAERVERIGKEGGHGPISGVAHEGHAEKTEGSAALPSGDIVALGRALEKMGVKISEHPSFGGVSPTAHGKNSAHYDGNAIDINATSGNRIEAQDPVTGPMFDRLAAQLQAAGYTVLWKVKNHYDHIHAQIGGKGIKGGHSAIGGEQGVTPGQTYSEHTPSSNIPLGESKQTSAGPMTSGESTMSPPGPIPISMSPQAASPMGSVMPMASMIPPMIGGEVGGIAGMLLPAIASVIQSQMVAAPSTPALNTQMVNQAAVSSQATEQTIQEAQTSFFNPTVNPEPNRMHSSDTSGFAYNMPEDIGWPDWAGMLGGNHWEEMKNYKKNMWG